MTPVEGVLLPAVTARPVHKHAVCGYLWQRAAGLRVPGTWVEVPALCGERVDLPQPDTATDPCPRCRLVAAAHPQTCDCFKLWPRATVEGSVAPRSLP